MFLLYIDFCRPISLLLLSSSIFLATELSSLFFIWISETMIYFYYLSIHLDWLLHLYHNTLDDVPTLDFFLLNYWNEALLLLYIDSFRLISLSLLFFYSALTATMPSVLLSIRNSRWDFVTIIQWFSQTSFPVFVAWIQNGSVMNKWTEFVFEISFNLSKKEQIKYMQ